MSILAPQHRPVVLVVDDDQAHRELRAGYLDGLGDEVRRARDGLFRPQAQIRGAESVRSNI